MFADFESFFLEKNYFDNVSFPDEERREIINVIPVYAIQNIDLLKVNQANRIANVFNNLRAIGYSANEIFEAMMKMGDLFFDARKYDVAAVIYQKVSILCRDENLKRDLFIEAVLKLSRADFSRGSNPVETAYLQKEAVDRMSFDNIDQNEALLMLYAGIVRHFLGDESEAYQLRSKAISAIQDVNLNSVKDELVALIGWNIYLSGRFNEAIEYYEQMILDIENHSKEPIATMAYPPIIYSYMFLGEYYKAIILTELIYDRAVNDNDDSTALLMRCIEGRLHVSNNENEKGINILYDAYAACKQKDYIWGQYYALCGMCNYYLNIGKINACHDNLMLLQELRDRYNIGRMYSSPFMLDVLFECEKQGYDAIPSMKYLDELQRHISLDNIHMKGVSLRHLAEYEYNKKSKASDILNLLDRSIELLIESGNQFELGRSYIAKAEISRAYGKFDITKKCASLAWEILGMNFRYIFPNDLIPYVDLDRLSPKIDSSLNALSLEIKHVFDADTLLLRLITRLSRYIGVESAGAAILQGGNTHIVATQSISANKDSTQYQRMFRWMSYVFATGEIVNKQSAKKQEGVSGSNTEPSFILSIPVKSGESVVAVVYFESLYEKDIDQDRIKVKIIEFINNESERICDVISYDYGNVEEQTRELINDFSMVDDIFVGTSESIRHIIDQISLASKSNAPVIISGETGTGKAIFAKEMYRFSECKGPLLVVKCGTIQESMIESQLCGYERGSFTGAHQTHKGLFEMARNGMLVFDEIADFPDSAQRILLKILQDGSVCRVGSNKVIPISCRIVVLTNRNLADEVQAGRLRADLFYRLNVLAIDIPPLRKRKSDIPGLANYFIHKIGNGKHFTITQDDIDSMFEYDWPGNVRELENIIQRSMLYSQNGRMNIGNLIYKLPSENAVGVENIKTLEEVEYDYIEQVLKYCHGKVSGDNGAAELLGIKRTTLVSRLNKLGINPSKFK